MIVSIENPETFEKLKKLSINKISSQIRVSAEPLLRSSFENASVNSTAMAVIELAKNMGYDDLAVELQKKLDYQTNKSHG